MFDLTDPANWDVPLFPASVVAVAANVATPTLRQWIVRYADDLDLWKPKQAGVEALMAGAKAEGDGLAHRFTLRGTLHIAAASCLINKGVTVKHAYRAAAVWAHIGKVASHWVGGDLPKLERLPAGLFARPAWTFLIHYAGEEARVVSVELNAGAFTFNSSDILARADRFQTPPTIVCLNLIDRNVRSVCQGYLA